MSKVKEKIDVFQFQERLNENIKQQQELQEKIDEVTKNLTDYQITIREIP